jgi:Protein HRI1
VSTAQPVPARFLGAWARMSLAVDGAAPAEHADVVWLQTEHTYADLRIPRLGYGDIVAPMSFAGTTTWADPFLRWSHELDLDPDGRLGDADVGRVHWHGDDLVETGELTDGDRSVPYTEVWRRLPASVVDLESDWSADGTSVVVRTGDHALTIADERAGGGVYRACYRTRRDDGWAVELALGDGATDLPAPPTEEMDPAMGVPTR